MIGAAFRYFGLIFALGFVLGTVRTVWLAPAIGATGAVLIELPIMLGASWLIARRLVTVPKVRTPLWALGTGALAFALLIAAEALLAITLAGQSLATWAGDPLRTPGWIGLAGQALFGLMPWLAALRPAGRPGTASSACPTSSASWHEE
jgi:hypothetical protein